MQNIHRNFEKQGLNADIEYEAIVVDNNDPDKLGRIRARIEHINEGIKDEHLPWAIAYFGHVDGAKGGDVRERSGVFFVPKKGTKVFIRFQDGNPHYPIWRGYVVDDKTRLKETNKHYPDRALVRFSNGSMVLIDTKSNELFIHSRGDMNLVVQGDLHTNVHGNVQEKCAMSKGKAIDPYILGDKEMPISEFDISQTKNMTFEGLEDHTPTGNKHIYVENDYTIKVDGDYTTEVKGNYKLKVKGKFLTEVVGTTDFKTDSTFTVKAKSDVLIQGSTVSVKGSMIWLN